MMIYVSSCKTCLLFSGTIFQRFSPNVGGLHLVLMAVITKKIISQK